MYILWAKNDFHKYFDKDDVQLDENEKAKLKERRERKRRGDSDESVQEVTDAGLQSDKGGRSTQSILELIENSRRAQRLRRDYEFLDVWNEKCDTKGEPGYAMRVIGCGIVPVSWLCMAYFRYKRF